MQSTCNGHINRSREIIRGLKKREHNVFVILSGRDPASLWDMDEFKPYRTYNGLTLSTNKGKVKYFKTICNLKFIQFFSDIASFYVSGYDIAVTDFEPITSRIASRHKIPLIGTGNQCAFYNDVPTEGANPLARFIIRNFVPADFPISLHWHHFNQRIIPPVVPKFNGDRISTIEDKILVYLPFEEPEDIFLLLAPF